MFNHLMSRVKRAAVALSATTLIICALPMGTPSADAAPTEDWGRGGGGRGDNAVRPGEFVVEPSTLISLGFEWYVNGDDNRNATVSVQYRKSGGTWTQGMNMLRIHGEVNPTDATLPYIAPNMFAGSILDLEANTTYEVQMTMHDPDGVEGRATEYRTVKTRAQPA